MEEQRLGRELRVTAVVEVGLERLDERFLALERKQLRQAGVDELAGVRRLGGAGEQPVGPELLPPGGRAVLGQRAGDAQREPRVLVCAMRLAQVVVLTAVAKC